MGQVFAYKRLNTIENYKTVRLISGRGHLLEVFVYKRFWSRDLTGNNLVFWMDGCFMGGGRLRDKWWWHAEVQPYGEFAERSRHFFFLSSHVLMMSVWLHVSCGITAKPLLLVCTWRHGGHVGGQEQKHFSPVGTKLYFHVNSLRKYSFVLTPNMAALSRGCKPRITWLPSAKGKVVTGLW